jgi:hypothetical protein
MWRDAFVESDDLLFLAFILQELHGQPALLTPACGS